MLSKYGRMFVAEPLAKLVMVLHRAGVTPNMLTYIGFAITAVSAFYLARGSFVWGGAILLLAAFFDMLDGSLARATNQSSVFGAFIDSTLDRYAESITFLALAYHYIVTPGGDTQLILIFLVIVGSIMVSYTRARAEGLDIECKGGFLQRPERIVLLVIGLIVGGLLPILWILAIFTNFTALQRIYDVHAATSRPTPVLPPPVTPSKAPAPGDNQPV